jgi:dTDP-4-dehydrorhamnose reductase
VLQLSRATRIPSSSFIAPRLRKWITAKPNVETAMRVNAIGTQNVALAAESLGVPLLVHFDGLHFRRHEKRDPTTNGMHANPQSVYGKSKYAGELFRAPALPVALHRARVVADAARNGPNFIETILKLARERDVLKVVNDQHGSPTFVADLVPELIRV